jgi:hypothetical protein
MHADCSGQGLAELDESTQQWVLDQVKAHIQDDCHRKVKVSIVLWLEHCSAYSVVWCSPASSLRKTCPRLKWKAHDLRCQHDDDTWVIRLAAVCLLLTCFDCARMLFDFAGAWMGRA